MKCTKGENRGAIALGCILAVVLAVLAWCNRPVPVNGAADALPDAVKARVDSAMHPGHDSCAESAIGAGDAPDGKRSRRLKNVENGDKSKGGGRADENKEARPQQMRPSPLDDVNS